MEQDRLMQFVADLQDVFLEGRWHEFHRYFSFPVVIYTVVGVKVVRDARQLLTLMEQYLGELRAQKVQTSAWEIIETNPPKNHRLRITVCFHGSGSDGAVITTTLVRYFLLDKGGKFRIEMMEYLQEPFSKSVVERILH